MPERAALLRGMALFAGISDAELGRVASRLTEVRLPAGEYLFRKGDPGDAMYALVQGRLLSFDGDEAKGDTRRGEPVGEMAMLTGEPRAVSVRAARDSLLLRLGREEFDALLPTSPLLSLGLARGVVRRGVRRDHASQAATAAIAVVPSAPDVDALGLARRIAGALGQGAHTVAVADVEAALGSGSAEARPYTTEGDRLAAWLGALEDDAPIEILVGAHPDSAWTRRIANQADAVVVAVDGRSPVDEGLAGRLRGGDARLEMAVVAPGPLLPAWRVALHLTRQHVVDADGPIVARLARALVGRSVTVVLGGGGARGFAHVGVLRALREAGVPIDAIGGTSMGAVIGALHATGLTPPEIEARLRAVFVDGASVFDFTLPVVSLIRAQRLGEGLHGLFGDARIEELAVPFFCVSASLGRAEIVVHEDGPVWHAVKASGSIPGVGPPVVKGDDLLVDGGVLDNLPIDVARRLRPGTVIGVSVTPGVDRGSFPPYDENVGALGALWRRLRPGPKPPSIVGILLRAAYLGTSARLDRLRDDADVFLEPPVASFRPLDPRPFERIVQAGYEHARQRLADPAVRATLGL